jgi:UDP-N-acetylglucosamine:LPS N-acetylglucosamine transferase
MQTLTLVYFNAGGGHRAAAQALAEVMAQQHRPWRVERVNLVDIIDPQGLFRRCTGMAPEDLYNKRLASGFTLGLAQELKLLQGLIRVAHGALVQRLHRHWLQTQPDAVVSLIPNFNRALAESVAAARPGAPFVTVMTDMADHPPHFWAEPGTGQHLVCGTAHAAQQALAAGLPAAQVHRVPGMILRPAFHDAAAARARSPEQRAEARRGVGLDPLQPTGLVLFGGTGSLAMKRIAQRLPDTPLILMCGRNAALARTLRDLPAPASGAARVVVEFTPDVARWMALADFFIGKPGPGSLSEAVHMGLPVIVTRNAGTMPQERWNTDWVRQHGLGLVLRSFGQIAPAVAELQRRLPELRANARAMPNRALYEVPEILQQLLQPGAAPPPRAAAPSLQVLASPA